MSKIKIMINYYIIFIVSLSLVKADDYINRNYSYNNYFDCKENLDEDSINSAEDCFKKSPRTKWKCCYFEYNDSPDGKTGKGCMRVRKGNQTDLNDLKYFISKISSNTVFNCKQSYLIYYFGFSISLLILMF